MWLAVRYVKKPSPRLEDSCYLFKISDSTVPPHDRSGAHLVNISTHVFFHVVFGIPQRTMEHGIECTLAECELSITVPYGLFLSHFVQSDVNA